MAVRGEDLDCWGRASAQMSCLTMGIDSLTSTLPSPLFPGQIIHQEGLSPKRNRIPRQSDSSGSEKGTSWEDGGCPTLTPTLQVLRCLRALIPQGCGRLTTCGHPGLQGPTRHKRGTAWDPGYIWLPEVPVSRVYLRPKLSRQGDHQKLKFLLCSGADYGSRHPGRSAGAGPSGSGDLTHAPQT